MAWNVLVRKGVLQLQDPGPPLPFLRSQPPGAYTTTRSTNNASNILLWERHMERLAQSVQLLSKEMPHLFPNSPEKSPCFVEHVKSLVQPSLRVGLQKALELRNEGGELLIMAYITGEKEDSKGKAALVDQEGFDVYIHISRCMPIHPESDARKAIRVAIMGLGRFLPNAKHTDWIRTRQALEKTRPKDVTEVILSNDGDLLLEGMITNFFVVVSRRTSAEAELSVNQDQNWNGLMLQTAPLKGVLPGVVRKLVLEICDENGISSEQSPPSWRYRGSWKEAFTTNSVHLIQPVGHIQSPVHWDGTNEPHYQQEESWEHFTLKAPGSLTDFIQSQLLDKAAVYSTSIDSLLGVLA
ncbi:hypothetical protein GOP47_0006735 [Adiantum capillus-veneris]|uniref:Uncharacterized protein n=1 Tax=Adiantum capillus-veneris TaxID=13818 RepID=A0A9D4ZMS3_ADICA|nr:hypothetical protein GOP47_0006161 [Adiantum capillus-veneris]KAI5079064.1 hypothetical protein GOP47_0006735 [Adiantum capillus-veneris]